MKEKLTEIAFCLKNNKNRASFRIFSNGKFEIEYIWDQELQNEVDKHKK